MSYDRFIRPILYIFCAGIATLVDLFLLFLLTDYFRIMYLVSASISYTAGIFVNFSLNRKITYKSKSKQVLKQFLLFSSIALVWLFLTLILMAFFVEVIGLWYMFAKLITIMIVFIWSYNANTKLTFRIFK